MSRPPKKPSAEKPVVILEKQPEEKQADAAVAIAEKLGLSKTEYDTVVKAMLRVVRLVGCPVHVRPLEVVHDALVMAAVKPSSERKSIIERKKLVPWLRSLARNAALSNRKSKHQKLLGQGHSEDEMDVLLSTSGDEDRIAAREVLRKAWPLLKPAHREILEAFYIEGKTIQEIAVEKRRKWTTVNSRYERAMSKLRYIMQSMLAAIILLVTKNARAQSVRLAQHVSRLVPHATQTACAMTVTVACGVLVPASSLATTMPPAPLVSMVSAPPSFTKVVAMVPTEPPSSTEVEQVKPITLDMLQTQCSAARMKSNKIVGILQGTVLPFAFLVAPAVTQLGCAGTEGHSPPPREPEERDDSPDPYDMMCANERRRGNDCPTKAEWYASFNRCPDGTRDCLKK